MTGWKLLRYLLALASLAVQATLAQAIADPARSTDPLPSRQILVMLKVTPEHLRPGSAYAGNFGARYGDSSRSRPDIEPPKISRARTALRSSTAGQCLSLESIATSCASRRASRSRRLSRRFRATQGSPGPSRCKCIKLRAVKGASSTGSAPPDRTRGRHLAACRFAQVRNRSRSDRRDHRQQDRRSPPRS